MLTACVGSNDNTAIVIGDGSDAAATSGCTAKAIGDGVTGVVC